MRARHAGEDRLLHPADGEEDGDGNGEDNMVATMRATMIATARTRGLMVDGTGLELQSGE